MIPFLTGISPKPFAPSCEQNQAPILEALRELLADRKSILEIGAGTGQHAVYFGARLPHLRWQPTDRAENLPGISLWVEEAQLPNVAAPFALDVRRGPWPRGGFDGAFSANAVHIMGWEAVKVMFAGLGRTLAASSTIVLYGPFNYGGRYTALSNERFDAWLKRQTPESGVRNFEDLDALARAQGFAFWRDVEMPADNRTLAWRRG